RPMLANSLVPMAKPPSDSANRMRVRWPELRLSAKEAELFTSKPEAAWKRLQIVLLRRSRCAPGMAPGIGRCVQLGEGWLACRAGSLDNARLPSLPALEPLPHRVHSGGLS